MRSEAWSRLIRVTLADGTGLRVLYARIRYVLERVPELIVENRVGEVSYRYNAFMLLVKYNVNEEREDEGIVE